MVYGHETEIGEEVLPVYRPNEGVYSGGRCLWCRGTRRKSVRKCNRCITPKVISGMEQKWRRRCNWCRNTELALGREGV